MSVTYQLTDEQRALREVVARFVGEEYQSAELRRAVTPDQGYDLQLWHRLAGELGLPALAVPASFDGAGASMTELAIVLEQTGAALLASPLFATSALAASLLADCDDDAARADFLPKLATGTTGTVAVRFTRDLRLAPEARADKRGSEWTLHGRASFVLDGASAEIILVVAATSSGPGVFCVAGDAPGLARAPMHTLDLTRPQAVLEFRSVPARAVVTPDSCDALLAAWLDRVVTALAAEQVGGAQHCLDAAVDYARTREQFGEPIGRFQAIKHKCADIFVTLESARTAAWHAAQIATADPQALGVVAPIAKAMCSEAFVFAAAESLHIHGGIGFTWEHDAHLYYRRARASAAQFGTPAGHRELLVSRLGL